MHSYSVGLWIDDRVFWTQADTTKKIACAQTKLNSG